MLKNIDHTYASGKVLPDRAISTMLENKRHFSNRLRETNRAFLPYAETDRPLTKVGFILPDHFSMVSFTAAVDVLVTANLVHPEQLFAFSTFGVSNNRVSSDLGVEISTDSCITDLIHSGDQRFDVLVVCGGFRCAMAENMVLSSFLKSHNSQSPLFAGIWNGAIPLAYAGLMEGVKCAVHPDNHAFMREQFKHVTVTENILELGSEIFTSSGPASALEMMLQVIDRLQGKEIMRAVRDILCCDQESGNGIAKLTVSADNPAMPQSLQDAIQLMRNNIEDPLDMEDLVAVIGLSRRQIERLFKTHLKSSPRRYYLELRVTQARRLLLQSNASITDVAIACGFVTSSHFSNCFKDYFGYAPSRVREKYREQFG